MPARSPITGQKVADNLVALGARLRTHRKALGINATTMAEAAGMSRVTLHRIEGGEPSVTMGAYMSAISSLGLGLELVDRSPQKTTKRKLTLPRRIAVADYPQLRRLAWQLGPDATLTPNEALALYERNWRHIDKKNIGEPERGLIEDLVEGLGRGRRLV